MKFPLISLEDDTKETVSHLIEHRLPWLILGLIGGLAASVFSSQFETLLSENIVLVFFIPVIVYMADAVGTQTETIYIRNAAKRKLSLTTYLVKEFLTGCALGIFFGLLIGTFAYFWLSSAEIALTVGFSMLATVSIAPVIALLIPVLLQKERTDPALGAGPFATVLQDMVSLGIYLLIASLMLFK